MRPRAIVSDLDRTLTDEDLALDLDALARIQELRAAGIRVIVATGRRFDELLEMGLPGRVDGIVAENGAIICVPLAQTMEMREPEFRERARDALGALSLRFTWGRVLGSGPRELALVAARRLRGRGIGHHLEYNAQEVMLLPPGVDKASGAALCLKRMGLGAQDAWAIGDGENDAAMLRWARVGAAPANAAPAAKAAADVLVASAYGRAFLELTTPLAGERAAPRA